MQMLLDFIGADDIIVFTKLERMAMVSDNDANQLAAEKRAQIEGATVILRPLTFIADIVVFAVCFWRYELGQAASIGAAYSRTSQF